MKNVFAFHRRRLRDLLTLDSHDAYHTYLITEGVHRYARRLGDANLGSVLAVCANHREAAALAEFPFERITLSGIDEIDRDGGTLRAFVDADSRIEYRRENCEALTFETGSFDLVFCKEGLHHLARPVQGLYEMLRVCRRAAVFVEAYDSAATRALEVLGLTTFYERNENVNLVSSRPNFVYRWNKRQLSGLLNSYYVDSGYRVDITLGWMSGRLLHDRPSWLKAVAYSAGVGLGFVPGIRGNFATVMIQPGSDIPPDPIPISDQPRPTRS